MEYKGIELKEVTEPQLFNPPKKMLVWDHYGDVVELKVYPNGVRNLERTIS